MAPAAPSEWPVTPLIEVTGGPGAPNSLAIASASAASLSGVEVPWALTWRDVARRRARRRPAPAPCTTTAPRAAGGGGGDVVGVGGGGRRRAPRRGSWRRGPRRRPRPRGRARRRPRRSRSRRGRRRTARDTPRDDIAVMFVEAGQARPASWPPRCRRRARRRSGPTPTSGRRRPSAWVPAAQAVLTVWHGPCQP